MDVYIYQSALYCNSCGEVVKADLDKQGKTPRHPEDEHTFDSDDYPKGPYPDGGGEADTPQHCDTCQVLLENDLTLDGQNYVETSIVEHLTTGRGSREVLDTWVEAYSDQLDWADIGRQVWGKK